MLECVNREGNEEAVFLLVVDSGPFVGVPEQRGSRGRRLLRGLVGRTWLGLLRLPRCGVSAVL